MTQAEQLARLFGEDEPEGYTDNVTEWCLGQFQGRYPQLDITTDDIWHYLYGVMHAPDWREKYRHDLQRNLPRVPLADDFLAFRDAGAELMELHIGYETCPEHPDVVCEVKGQPDEGQQPNGEVYRIGGKLRWGKDAENSRKHDRSVLLVNDRCRLTGIPAAAHEYEVSGRSPLDWAVHSLKEKTDNKSGIVDDPNGWHVWDQTPFELIRHLRRLAYVGVRSAEIISGLPPSLPQDSG